MVLYLLDTNILVHLIRRDGIGEYIRNTYAPFLIEPKPLISAVSGVPWLINGNGENKEERK